MSDHLNVTNVVKWPGGPFAVLAAHAPHRPSIVDCRKPGHFSALLSHDRGMNWPDKRGEMILSAVLQEAGTVVLIFEDRGDAEACRTRLLGTKL